MPMDENPDAMPETGSGITGFIPADISLTAAAQQFLYQTGSWARFMSVMIFIWSAVMALSGLGTIMLSIGSRIPLGPRQFSLFPVGYTALGAFYILFAILYVAPGVFLFRYAGAIGMLRMSRSAQALEDAFRNQKSFWRYVGILTIIHIVLGAILIVFVLFFVFHAGIMHPMAGGSSGVGNVSGVSPGAIHPPVGGGYGAGIVSRARPYVVGNGVTPPMALVQPLPAYTPEARKARVEGVVLIKAVIRKDGSVDSFEVEKGLGYGLDESAINTIAQKWRFKPGTYRGEPVDVQANIEVSFKLY
jgi:TonB family protein